MDAHLTLEQLFAAIPAHWEWKDDVKKLELVSLQPIPDSKDKKALSRVRAILDPLYEALEKSQYGVSRRAYVSMTKEGGVALSSLPGQQQQQDGSLCGCVTLNDIKHAALLLLGDKDSQAARKRFQPMLRTQQLDDFLMALISYFSVFLSSLGSDLNIVAYVTNVDEKVEMDGCQCKMEQAQKQLARTYSTLLLGLGMTELHHMAGGRSLGSATRKDRQLFECLYAYSVHVIWVAFRRKNLDVIRTEVGRLLRSDAFNPAQYIDVKEKDNVGQKPRSQYRGQQAKRPAISTMMHQRSPALTAVLPSAKDKSDYLFKQRGVQLDLGALQPRDWTSDLLPHSHTSQPPPLGILGEPLSKFLRETLIPFELHTDGSGGEGEEEGEEQEEEQRSVLSLSHAITMSRTTTAGTESRQSLLR